MIDPRGRRHLRTFSHEEAADRYMAGNSLSQVADSMSISVGAVRTALKTTGTQTRPANTKIRKPRRYGHNKGKPLLKKRKFDHESAIKCYLEGNSLDDVGRMFSVDPELVRGALQRAGIQRRARGSGTGSLNHQFKGGLYQRKDGYKLIRGKREKPLEHRILAERALGRPLKRTEDVHHVDANRSNNRPSNLIVCTHAYHMSLHARMRKHPYWSQFKKGIQP